jgi:peptidoglycan hydrolase-like protein with peptidoglycan-binding domain
MLGAPAAAIERSAPPKRTVAAAPAPVLALSPLPAPRPRADAPSQRSDLVHVIQRELASRGYYTGPLDGLIGPRTERAIRDFEETEGAASTGEPSEALLGRILKSRARQEIAGPVTNSVTPREPEPTTRVLAVQRVLARLGYGPVVLNGIADAATRAAIGRFQRDRGLREDGEITDRLVSEIAAVTGAPVQ